MLDIDPEKLLKGFMIVGLGVWGGLSRFLGKNEGSGKKGWSYVGALVSTAFVSGFFSALSYPASEAMNLSDPLSLAFGGTVGYMGLASSAIFINFLKRKVGEINGCDS